MRKVFCSLLALCFLLPAAGAVDDTSPIEERCEMSSWARETVIRASELGLARRPVFGDLREPIQRGEFGEDASALTALAYRADLDCYLRVKDFRDAKAGRETGPVAQELGILQGKENGNLDLTGLLTRQEAAVMLARAYRTYAAVPDGPMAPLSYEDQAEIADWAQQDVQFMTHLGIMAGVEGQRFDPQGPYTAEQCFVTLCRLYEKTCQSQPPVLDNPLAMTVQEAAIGTIWSPGDHLFTYQEQGELFAMAYARYGGTMAGQKCYITVVEADGSHKTYPSILVARSNPYYGERFADIDALAISPDGTSVTYQSTLENDVYHTDANGEPEQLLWEKGRYTVTIDRASGEQSYTREALG